MTHVAGPVGRVIECDGAVIKPRTGYQLEPDANALILLNRVALLRDSPPAGRPQALLEDKPDPLLRLAAGHRLGQQPRLIADAAARRARALDALRASGHAVARLEARTEWRLAVGLGNKGNAHEIGLSLHGTYGWPVIPASSLKGMTAALAVSSGTGEDEVESVLGAPRPPRTTSQARQGAVCFLDAIPAGRPVTVAVDVLTPHVKPYYDSTMTGDRAALVPPAEYHNPVPVNFLTVSGVFAVDLYGRDAGLVDRAAHWLTAAGEELGVGAKTAAGYGYLVITPRREAQARA